MYIQRAGRVTSSYLDLYPSCYNDPSRSRCSALHVYKGSYCSAKSILTLTRIVYYIPLLT